MRVLQWRSSRPCVGAALALSFFAGAALSSSLASRAASPQSGKINTEQKNGTIIFSDWEFPDTLNLFQTGLGVTSYVMNAVYEGLDLTDNHARLQPDLLSSLPSIQNHEILDGGRTIILRLRHGIYWSSGVEITNQDILFGWKMYSDPITGPACLDSCDHIASIRLVGKYEAILKLKDIYAPILLAGLPPVYPHSWSRLGLTPHDAAVKLSQDTTFNYQDSSYWTDGPYQVSNFVKDDRIELTPMKYYHVHRGPFLKKMIFAYYSSKDGLIAAAGNGNTDVTSDYTYDDLPALRQHAKRYKIWVTPSFVAEHLEFNVYDSTFNGQPNPVHNVKVRQALTLAVDKTGLCQSALALTRKQCNAIVGYTPLTVTPTFKQQFGDTALKGTWDPVARKYLPFSARTLADARKLLIQAGYAHGFTLDFLTTLGNPTRAAEFGVLAKNWEPLGVTLIFDAKPPSTFGGDWNHGGPRNHGAFQVNLWTFGSSPDPDVFRNYFVSKFIDRATNKHSAVNSNYAGIDDPVIDNAMQKGASSFDQKVRARWYKVVQEQLNKEAYWVILYYRANVVTSDKHVVGDTPYPTSGVFGNTWNPWAWSFKGG